MSSSWDVEGPLGLPPKGEETLKIGLIVKVKQIKVISLVFRRIFCKVLSESFLKAQKPKDFKFEHQISFLNFLNLDNCDYPIKISNLFSCLSILDNPRN